MRTRRAALVILFVAIFACWWGVSVFTGQVASAPLVAATEIVIHHTHNGETHTFSGVIPLVSVCDTLGAGLKTEGSNPIHVTIPLSITLSSSSCANAAGAAGIEPFSVSLSVKASDPAPVLMGVTINGTYAPIAVVEGN